jgi:hypothetical protein
MATGSYNTEVTDSLCRERERCRLGRTQYGRGRSQREQMKALGEADKGLIQAEARTGLSQFKVERWCDAAGLIDRANARTSLICGLRCSTLWFGVVLVCEGRSGDIDSALGSRPRTETAPAWPPLVVFPPPPTSGPELLQAETRIRGMHLPPSPAHSFCTLLYLFCMKIPMERLFEAPECLLAATNQPMEASVSG